jgi:hypothetical protein
MFASVCLQLAEVEVMGYHYTVLQSNHPTPQHMDNLALLGIAEQSCSLGDARAHLAIDGRTNGDFSKGSVSSTCCDEGDQWWKVTFPYGSENFIHSITIYNREDCCGERLNDFMIEVLDADDNVVWSHHQDFSVGLRNIWTPDDGTIGCTVRIRMLRQVCL